MNLRFNFRISLMTKLGSKSTKSVKERFLILHFCAFHISRLYNNYHFCAKRHAKRVILKDLLSKINIYGYLIPFWRNVQRDKGKSRYRVKYSSVGIYCALADCTRLAMYLPCSFLLFYICLFSVYGYFISWRSYGWQNKIGTFGALFHFDVNAMF